MEKKICPGCNGEYTVIKSGRLRSHKGDAGPVEPCSQESRPHPSLIECACGKIWEGTPQDGHGALECGPVSDPAPTVEPMDDTPVPAEHQPGRPPAQAEVDYWQQQAREAAQRHVVTTQQYEDRIKELVPWAPPIPEIRIPAAPGPMPTPDEFMDPAEPEVKLNVSGQPPARRDHQKRYLVVDPDLGDFRRYKNGNPIGITRATTFNKHAQNTIGLRAWALRNVVMGASLRPDILRRAHGLTHETGKQELDRIVDELETAAGAKVAADEGTFLHEFCEQVDAGLKTWQDAPAAYQQDIKRYVEALAAAGLEPVPGLIERTVFIREYGGVCGTFDNVYYHRPSGQYVIGDKKTGKTMSYAMDETECQIFTYAHGVNQHGVYDWNTDTWQPLGTYGDRPDGSPWDWTAVPQVSEKVGVIIHMPVQGPEAGEVYLRYADLECGRAYAELNHSVRSYPKSKVRPFEMPSAEPVAELWQDIGGGVEVRHSVVDVPTPERPRDWHAEFSTVATREEANALYKEAKASGLGGWPLRLLVDIGKEALTRLATQPEDR